MRGFRLAAFIVALTNLAFFGLEFAVAIAIGSVSLFADSIDFLEDAAVNGLIVVAVEWPVRRRGWVGTLLSGVLLVPTIAALWTAARKIVSPAAPAPEPLMLTGLAALAVNLGCAFLLARYRRHHGSLSRAAFLSAPNDAVANVAIIAAGAATLIVRNAWPDLVVGVGIGVMNAGAAREVFEAARKERLAPGP